MKNYSKYLILLLGILSPLVYGANKQVIKHEVKCHVELYGGKEVIYFGLAPLTDLKNYAQAIVGKKISVPTIKGKKSIYKAFECVVMNDKFTSRQARLLDSKTPK